MTTPARTERRVGRGRPTTDISIATARPSPGPAPSGRHFGDVVRIVVGVAVLLVSVLAVQRDHLTVFERNLFRLVNDLPSTIEPVVVAAMQLGNVVAAPVLAGVALLFGGRRLASRLLIAGPIAWILAKVVKDLMERPRPTGFLEDVARYEGTGLGFVSGHTAVAAALAAAAAAYLPRRAQRLAWAAAWFVGLGRIYVGAHLPMDVVGGAALGWVIGAGIHLVLGAPHRRPTLAEVRAALQRTGWSADRVVPAGVSPLGSFPFVAWGAGGRRFAKLLDPEPRESDLAPRLARYLLRRDVRDEVVMADTKCQAEHEVAMTLLARQAGCRVPAVLGLHYDGRQTWVIEEYAGPSTLDHVDDLDDELLRAAWEQVATLHAAGIVHRDLVAANIVIDEKRQPWIVDLAHAESSGDQRKRRSDIAELLASTALLVGTGRAVSAARSALGGDTVRSAAAELQPLVLTASTRAALRAHRGLLDELRLAALGPEPPTVAEPPRRQWIRWAFVVAGLAGSATVVAASGAADLADRLPAGAWRWYGALVLVVATGWMLGGWLVIAAAGHRLAAGRAALAAVASDTSTITTGESRSRVLARALRRSGLGGSEADEAITTVGRVRIGASVLWLGAAAAWAAWADVDWSTPRRGVVLAVAAAALAAALGTVHFASGRHGGHRRGRAQSGWLAAAGRVAVLLPIAAGEAGMSMVVLVAAEKACGGDAAVAVVLLAGAVGALLARAGPGLVEVALVLVLSVGGLDLATAAATTLVARVVTYWLPAVALSIAHRWRPSWVS